LIGIELAEMLRSRNIQATLGSWKNILGGVLPSAKAKWSRHIAEHHIDLKLETNLVEIISDENGHVKAVITDKGETINCELVGLTTVSPNIDFKNLESN
jgi:NADPH-dependent 2,4-dienoyl-CoA reductase/sulfur reductase-like enzyme